MRLYKDMTEVIDDAMKYDYNMIIEEFDFYLQLSPKLQNDICLLLFKDFMKNFSHFFDSCELGFRNELIINLFVRRYPSGTKIAMKGKKLDQMFFICEGRVDVYGVNTLKKFLSYP